MRPILWFIVGLMGAICASSASAQSAQKWVTSWTGSVQGPYPVGNPSAEPDLRFAFPSPETGARDQSFRLIVRPDLWGPQVRLRFSNALGTRPVTFDGVQVGLQRTAAALVPGSNQPVSFAGKRATTVAPGSSVWARAVLRPRGRRRSRCIINIWYSSAQPRASEYCIASSETRPRRRAASLMVRHRRP